MAQINLSLISIVELGWVRLSGIRWDGVRLGGGLDETKVFVGPIIILSVGHVI
jgi:hypothetical protein